MRLLIELLSEIALETVTPESDRGVLLLAFAAGGGLCGAAGWLLITIPRPLYGPEWGFTTIVCGIVFGSAGAILAGMHLAREEQNRLLAGAATLLNTLALTLAAAAFGR